MTWARPGVFFNILEFYTVLYFQVKDFNVVQRFVEGFLKLGFGFVFEWVFYTQI